MTFGATVEPDTSGLAGIGTSSIAARTGAHSNVIRKAAVPAKTRESHRKRKQRVLGLIAAGYGEVEEGAGTCTTDRSVTAARSVAS